MFPMFSPFSVETEYFFFFSFLEAGCVSLQLYMKSISHVSKHNINKQQCCHSCAISRLLSAFGIAFLTLLSPFSSHFSSPQVFSFVPLSRCQVCGLVFFLFVTLTDCFWIQALKQTYFGVSELSCVFCSQYRVCSLQCTYSCIEMEIKFKCEFCFGWNTQCHYYILALILANL